MMQLLKNNATLLIGLGSLIVLILTYKRIQQPAQIEVKTQAPRNTIVKQFAPQVVGPGNELEVQLNFAERMQRLGFSSDLFKTILEFDFARDQLAQAERLQKLEYEYLSESQKRQIDAEASYQKFTADNSMYSDAKSLMGLQWV